MKVVLAALNHLTEDHNTSHKSNLYKALLKYKNGSSSRPLNPDEVRKELYKKEKDRILQNKVNKNSRLFHFSYTSAMNPTKFDDQEKRFRKTQQDAQDFFLCLKENRHHFPDVFELFKFTSVEYTVCRQCGGESRSGDEAIQCVTFMSLPTDKTMAQLIYEQFNESTVVPEWRHEGGNSQCRYITRDADKFFKIKDIDEVKFLVIRVDRVRRQENDTLFLVETEVPVGGDVEIMDFSGVSALFKPIAVLHHQGFVLNNETAGHYQADVLHPESQQWYQTSDDSKPFQINNPSSKGYIFIYKKI